MTFAAAHLPRPGLEASPPFEANAAASLSANHWGGFKEAKSEGVRAQVMANNNEVMCV